MSSKMHPRVLVAPLDWGLGHATRCIPVIHKLVEFGTEVTICASGGGKVLLEKRFPLLDLIEIPSYQVSYPIGGSMAWSMMRQTIPMMRSINKEHDILENMMHDLRFTHIISDNRYGIYSRNAKNAIITHQLNIMTPSHLKALRPLIRGLVKKYVNVFDECWVPDHNSMLSGKLSDPMAGISSSVHNIGVLSRFENMDKTKSRSEYDVIAVISGPEPQRTIFSDLIKEIFSGKETRVLIAGGQPRQGHDLSVSGNITVRNDIDDEQLVSALHEDTLYIGRSGYSTVMDLVTLRHQKVLLVPTPGQTEQEYLATFLNENYGTTVCDQNELRIPEKIHPSEWPSLHGNDQKLEAVLRDFLGS